MAQRTCSVDICERPEHARGLCTAHYFRLRETGDVDAARPIRGSLTECSVPGCERAIHGRGFCCLHYERFRKFGDPLPDVPVRSWHLTAEERFWTYVDRRGPDECWEWQGTKDGRGYGSIWFTGKTRAAHRVSLTMAIGLPPDGEPDWCLHRCDNPPCVNPAHLYWGSHEQNMRDMRERGRALGGRALKTTCPKGHPYPEGERVGARVCAVCLESNRRRKSAGRKERYHLLRAAGHPVAVARDMSGLSIENLRARGLLPGVTAVPYTNEVSP